MTYFAGAARRSTVVLPQVALVLSLLACAPANDDGSDAPRSDTSAGRCKDEVIYEGRLYEYHAEVAHHGAPIGDVEVADCFDLQPSDPPLNKMGSGLFVRAYEVRGVDPRDAFVTDRYGSTSEAEYFVFVREDATATVRGQLPKNR